MEWNYTNVRVFNIHPYEIDRRIYVKSGDKSLRRAENQSPPTTTILHRMSRRFIPTTCPINYRYYGPVCFKILYTSHPLQVLSARAPAYFQSTDLRPPPQYPTIPPTIDRLQCPQFYQEI